MRIPHILMPGMLAGALALGATAAHAEFTTPRPSPNATVTQVIGTTTLSVTYSRPGVKGREIWGALVPWDKPWRTGANEVTRFETTDPVRVEGKELPAGAYGVVTIPSASGWVIAFTRDKGMWGANDYKPEHDQLRVTVKPVSVPDVQERMRFTIEPTAENEADVVLAWEKLRVPFHVTVDVNGNVLASARAAIAAAKADDWETPYRAANWANGAGVAPEEVARWSAAALKTRANFFTVSLSAKLAAKAGRSKEAVEQGTKAVALGKADKDVSAEQLAPFEKQLAEWQAKP